MKGPKVSTGRDLEQAELLAKSTGSWAWEQVSTWKPGGCYLYLLNSRYGWRSSGPRVFHDHSLLMNRLTGRLTTWSTPTVEVKR